MSRLPLANLCKPFPPEDLEWRVGNVAKSGKMCTLLAYITSRAVMDRLDAVVGPENWKDEYHKTPLGNGFECRLSIRMTDGTWVTKIDGAEPTQIESIKGAYSDSFKRAAVKWGIGRYLYRLPLVWVPIQSKGQIYVSSKGTTGYATPPELPQWALPVTYQSKPPSVAPAAELPNPEPPKDETPHDELWTKDQKWFCAGMGKFGGYAAVRDWTVAKGWSKPSTWGTERRRNFVLMLEKGELHVGE